MSKKSFPVITGLACRSISTRTLTMTTSKPKQFIMQPNQNFSQLYEGTNSTDQPLQFEDESENTICPYCEGSISSIDTFCIHCGKELKKPSYRYCTRCGQRATANANVCTNCGTRLLK